MNRISSHVFGQASLMTVLAAIATVCLLWSAPTKAQFGLYQPDDRGYGDQVRCDSPKFRYRHCRMNIAGGVRLVQQYSESACVRGRTWGVNRDGVWVDRGCAARFEQSAGYGHDRQRPGYAHDQNRQTFRCESPEYKYRYCGVDTRYGVRLVRQISNTQCIRGQNWGVNPGGVWVDKGCAAEFGMGRDGYRDQARYAQQSTLRCKSKKFRYQFCPTHTDAGVRLLRQHSSKAQCVFGQNWGYDQRGIWVDQGCDAEFSVGDGYANGQDRYYPYARQQDRRAVREGRNLREADYGDGYQPRNRYDQRSNQRRNQPRQGGARLGDYGRTNTQLIRCESPDFRHRSCQVRIDQRVRIVRQISDTQCVQGRNWGFDRNRIWVDKGCAAEFEVD